MGNHEWDDDRIEQLLSNAPKIRDERPKEDILARLKNDPRLATEKKKPLNRWLPAAISAAAVLTIGIIGSSFILDGGQEVSIEVQEKNSAEIMIQNDQQPSIKGTEPGEISALGEVNESEISLTAVYQSDLDEGGYTPFHLGVVSQAEVIPVTFLIENERIKEDFPDKEPTELDLYNEYADDIHENAFGFSEFHPLEGNLQADGDTLIHMLPDDHSYDAGTAAEGEYFKIMSATFQEFHILEVKDQNGNSVEFSHTGKVEPRALSQGYYSTGYYLFELEDGQEVLAPWLWQKYTDLQAALRDMKTDRSGFFRTVIPEKVEFTFREEVDVLYVIFDEPLDLEAMDPTTAVRMVEGMLLAASSFDTQIQFENVMQENWGGFDFTEPLEMPVGPNKMYFSG